LPCVRKAPFNSRLTVAHKGDGKPNEDLLALAQVVDGVRITIKLAKIRALTHYCRLQFPLSGEGFDRGEGPMHSTIQSQSAALGVCDGTCVAIVVHVCVVQYPGIGLCAATSGRQTTPHVLASKRYL
jgi:hypothetical protein